MLKTVYALCCNDSGYYPEQCLMSLHALKKHNSDTPAHVIIDNLTNNCLKGKRLDALASYAEILTFYVERGRNTRGCFS